MKNSNNTPKEKNEKSSFKRFAAPRIIIGLFLSIAALWFAGSFLSSEDKTPSEHSAKKDGSVKEDHTNPHKNGSDSLKTPHFSDKDTALSIMDTQYISLHENSTVGAAIELIKDKEGIGVQPVEIYIVGEHGVLKGISAPSDLLVATKDAVLGDVMNPDVLYVKTHAAHQDIADLLDDHQMDSIPVIDDEKKLIGKVTLANVSRALIEKTEGKEHEPDSELSSHTTDSHEKLRDESNPSSSSHEDTKDHEEAKAHIEPETEKSIDDHKTALHPDTQSHEKQDSHEVHEGKDTKKHAESKAAETHSSSETEKENAHVKEDPHVKEDSHAKEDSHGGHGTKPSKPQAKGVAFVKATIQPMDFELNERFWGWRPNDIIDFTDNINNFQLGVLEVTRRTAVILAERISRTGAIESFDKNVENAMNWFMIKSDKYWFPSAESKYRTALKELEAYLHRLKKGHAPFYTRTDNLIPLLAAYEDLMGSCEENLVKAKEEDGSEVSFFSADDYFYYAKGVASAMLQILEAVEEDFRITIESRRGMEVLLKAIHACHHATEIDPWVITDSSLSGILANHRANLAAAISHVRFHLGVLIKTLST